MESNYPNKRKFPAAIGEYQSYIVASNASRNQLRRAYRLGERISSAFVEAAVNAVISKRFAKKQRILQTGTQPHDGSLRPTSRRRQEYHTIPHAHYIESTLCQTRSYLCEV